MNLPNITYKGRFSKCVGAKDDPSDFIVFFKPKDFFIMSDEYTRFVKDVEKTVRKHEDYKIYKDWLMNTMGLNFCQVSTDIYDTDATIEMHPGPLFSLFDFILGTLSIFFFFFPFLLTDLLFLICFGSSINNII